ncbi:sulfatase-like hydrolase/transferase [Shewanella sp. Scap07]|uniref:sulfatase-like hydrolase/transferase n=1 Tax=Shewanella sp. Scap07 TaxID=2589987 RepID=UPI0015BEC2B3|nr:sulfatase-like hydrolase/transferase [Shewanella sp. Scap07]QLE84931.1 sulfatase-like hydrolase/transferase [Shewanella sp. Scap07]
MKKSLLASSVVLMAACSQAPKATLPTAQTSQLPTDDRPNILIIIADDMGFSDIGAFGSEIDTPNINQLAQQGMSFTNFHVGATCSPTRTMLISGVDNHLAGLGNMHEIMADNQFGKPGYEGHLNTSVVTLATVLRDSGYHTYMAGKWHLGGTKDSIPYYRGFEQSFALAESGADNWVEMPYAPMYERVHYFENDKEVKLPTENYYSSDFYTQRIIDNIESNREDGKPFLAWLGYQAVHYPHQAPKAFIDKYNGVYDAGWHELRRQRLARQKQQGLFPDSVELDPSFDKTSFEDWQLPEWDSLSEEQKRFNARRMQTYAGMVDNMDHNIGKIFDYLKSTGELDNTLILFLSDNGTDPNLLSKNETYRPWYEKNYQYTYMEDYQGDYSTMGQKGSYADYGPGWAAAANTPNSYFKTFSTEGGLRVPLIAKFPKAIPANTKVNSFAFVKDIYPTLLEVAQVKVHDGTYNGKKVHIPDGTSAWSVMTGQAEQVHLASEAIGYELAGSSAVFQGKYKLSLNPPPKGTGEWELYDISVDPSERNNLATSQPERVKQMRAQYQAYAKKNALVPVPEGYNPLEQVIKNSSRAH